MTVTADLFAIIFMIGAVVAALIGNDSIVTFCVIVAAYCLGVAR